MKKIKTIKKIRIAFCIAAIAGLTCLWSCRNISAQDFGPDDIANILEVVLNDFGQRPEDNGSEAALSETSEPTEPADTSEPAITSETTEPEGPPDSGPPTEPYSEEQASETEPTAPPTEPEPETNPPTEPPPPETQESTDDEPPGYEPVATVINVRDVFPDAPEKFWDIQYPESVPMLDSLKKSINNLAGFSARDLKGRSFYIATTEPALFTPIYSGSMFSDARRYRTEIVDAECNTQITTIEKSRDEIVQDIIRSIQTDEFFADILCLPFDIQSELIVSGVLMNLKKTPFLNANAEYYNASATEAFTVNGNIFALVSDLTFDPSTVYAVFYNKSLLKQHEIKSPLVAYKNGAWNYDAMFAAAKELAAATADLNSEAGPVYSIGFDRENDDLTNGLFVASGNKYFTKRDYSYPVLNYANDKASKLIEAVQKIFAPEPESGIEAFFGRGEEAQNAEFFSGNVLFSFAKLDIIPDITDMGFDWGILPVPSLDGKYESGFSFADSNALCISVLKGAPNSEACGIVVSSLSAASHRQLKDIYKKEQMTFYLRDVDSVVILGDIISNMSFNQYSAYSSIPEIYRATVGTLKSAANKNGEFLDIYEGSRSALNDFFSSAPSFFARG